MIEHRDNTSLSDIYLKTIEGKDTVKLYSINNEGAWDSIKGAMQRAVTDKQGNIIARSIAKAYNVVSQPGFSQTKASGDKQKNVDALLDDVMSKTRLKTNGELSQSDLKYYLSSRKLSDTITPVETNMLTSLTQYRDDHMHTTNTLHDKVLNDINDDMLSSVNMVGPDSPDRRKIVIAVNKTVQTATNTNKAISITDLKKNIQGISNLSTFVHTPPGTTDFTRDQIYKDILPQIYQHITTAPDARVTKARKPRPVLSVKNIADLAHNVRVTTRQGQPTDSQMGVAVGATRL